MNIPRSTKWTHALMAGIGILAGISLHYALGTKQTENDEVTGHLDEAHALDETDTHKARKPDDEITSNAQGDHEEHLVSLSGEEIEEFEIELATASGGTLTTTLRLSGEVVIDPSALVHVVPRVAGVVQGVSKRLGEKVQEGELLATLASRELAEAKAQLIAASGRLGLADATLKRERALYEKKITAEREYLEARQARAEVAIEIKAAKQRLVALGLPLQDLEQLARELDTDLTIYELRAPTGGAILEKHITRGELLETNDRAFTIADLGKVWINLAVYQKDLPLVNPGQPVVVSAGFGIPDTEGVIDYVGPIVMEETRTATARVILDNREGRWRPGLFVTGMLNIAESPVEIAIPRSALQTIDGQTVVYVQTAEGFEPRGVRIGRSDQNRVEIASGLAIGERYVAKNAFVLKAEMLKGGFGDGHGH